MSFAMLIPKPSKSATRKTDQRRSAHSHMVPTAATNNSQKSTSGNLDDSTTQGGTILPVGSITNEARFEREADAFADGAMQAGNMRFHAGPDAGVRGPDLRSSEFAIQRSKHIDHSLDALGADGANVERNVFLHSSLASGSKKEARVLAHELAHVNQAHTDGKIRLSKKPDSLDHEVAMALIDHLSDFNYVKKNPAYQNHTEALISRMSTEDFDLYVATLKNAIGLTDRLTKDYGGLETIHGRLDRDVYLDLQNFYVNQIQDLERRRRNARKALEDWSEYLGAVHNEAVDLHAVGGEDSVKYQKDQPTGPELVEMQYACVFNKTWEEIQEHVERGYMNKESSSPSFADQMKYSYMEKPDADSFMKLRCAQLPAPGEFRSRLKFFPAEVARVLQTSDSAEKFATKFGNLVDDAVLGINWIDDVNGQHNEGLGDCPDDETDNAMTFAKKAFVGMHQKYGNVFMDCIPEASEGFLGTYDYVGLRKKAKDDTYDKLKVKEFDASKRDMTGFDGDKSIVEFLK